MYYVNRFDRIERADTEEIANDLLRKQKFYPLTDGEQILETEDLDEAIRVAHKTAFAMMTKDQVGSVASVTYATVDVDILDEDGDVDECGRVLLVIPQIGFEDIEVREE